MCFNLQILITQPRDLMKMFYLIVLYLVPDPHKTDLNWFKCSLQELEMNMCDLWEMLP